LAPNITGGTPFQQQVWDALEAIPYGKMVTYADIAQAIGAPKAVRAVGQAIHRNPLGIIIPCHRVIGKNGTLTGYAAGLSRKQWLLTHEQQHMP
jgi:O-6-methylguanine DNA methyltransferase